MNIEEFIREIPDFPKEGILFKDITPILHNPETYNYVIDKMVEYYSDFEIDYVAAIEARGFLFGPQIAMRLNKGFIPIRKPGKLPAEVISAEYELEYGTNTIEIHKDAVKPGDKILLIDDLLATGGTTRAAINLIEKLEGEVVGIGFLLELLALEGRAELKGYDIYSLISD
ncbi:adenine phosphoribosyltransferase [Halanaerobiaceae bacterium Z-7014]|uniref:Adenine phosphoribosyltransferase n=1 Tax=Halonatronomonas betaini TaxID=2778430 RepID=A0A931F948_9FIRM|nr:adenine phosphoribosyltransferase [Halonatronomonas betaini]MBF8436049.1 adenine phosphoribosyltransferase [Halonatronomonas betaini]